MSNNPKYFAKVAENMKIPKFTTGKIQHQFLDFKDKGIKYSDVSMEEPQEILKIIPSEFQTCFTVTSYVIDRDIVPHVDQYIITALNLYINTAECKTTFYEPKSSEPIKTSRLVTQTIGYMCDPEDLVEIDSFIAKPNELWLLDNSKIHSVSSPSNGQVRTVLQLTTPHFNFEQVYKMLKISGVINEPYSFGY